MHVLRAFCVRQAAQRDEWAQRVIVTYSDDVLREEQRRLDGRWRALEPFLHQVPARQELNAETALGLARARGMRWLLHLDADELFLPAAAGSLRGTGECARSFSVENAARTHFQALDDAGVGLVTYKNREGVAEHADHAPDATNVFQSVACFREHFSDIPLTPAAMACMREWSERSPVCAREGRVRMHAACTYC